MEFQKKSLNTNSSKILNLPFLDKKNRSVELDILRALAIVLIVAGHLSVFLEQGVLTKGLSFLEMPMLFLGLALFFFVSGFSLYLNNKVLKNYHDVVRFYKKRLVRIYPLYWIAVAVILVEYQLLSFTHRAGSITPAEVIITLIGAQALLTPRFGSIQFGLWFIGTIVILYLLYPLIIYYLESNKKLFFTVSLIYIAFLSIRVLFNIVDTRFFIFYWVFIGGILACKYRSYPELLTKPQRRLILLCGGVILVLILLFQVAGWAVVYNKLLLNNVVHLSAELWFECAELFAILLTVPLFLTVQLHTKQVSRNVYSFAFLLSFSSFCIYLFHFGILDDSKYIGTNFLHLSGFLLNLMIITVGLSLVFTIALVIQFTYNSAIERAKKT